MKLLSKIFSLAFIICYHAAHSMESAVPLHYQIIKSDDLSRFVQTLPPFTHTSCENVLIVDTRWHNSWREWLGYSVPLYSHMNASHNDQSQKTQFPLSKQHIQVNFSNYASAKCIIDASNGLKNFPEPLVAFLARSKLKVQYIILFHQLNNLDSFPVYSQINRIYEKNKILNNDLVNRKSSRFKRGIDCLVSLPSTLFSQLQPMHVFRLCAFIMYCAERPDFPEPEWREPISITIFSLMCLCMTASALLN